MSEYARLMKPKIERWEAEWDMTNKLNRDAIRRLKRRAWWHSGPSTAFAALVGVVLGSTLGMSIGLFFASVLGIA